MINHQAESGHTLDTVNATVNRRALRSGLINPFSYKTLKISSHEQLSATTETPPVIKLAFICLNLTGKTSPDDCELYISPEKTRDNIDESSLKRQLHHLSKENTHFDDYKLALEKAVCEYQANVVCVNELGFPTTDKNPSSKAIDLTTGLVSKYRCVIFCGSYHDSRTFYNTGNVYFPLKRDDSEEIEVVRQYYHKQVCAKDRELVSIPADRKSISISAFGINIGVIICLDLLDYSTIAPLIDPGRNINLILVPSYCDNMGPMQKVAKQMSSVLPGYVTIANPYLSDYNENPIRMNLFGETLSNSKTESSYPYYQVCPLPDNKGTIILHDINISEFLRKKQYHFNNPNPDLRLLFGLPVPQQIQP